MRKNIFDLSGRVVVITGAAGLLGEMHADAIAGFGGSPVLIDQKGQEARELSERIKKQYDVDCSSWEIDITDESAVEEGRIEIIENYGRIDSLINNAANNPTIGSTKDVGEDFTRLERFTRSSWDQDLEVGLTGAFLCAKHFGSAIAKNATGGVIINISSDLALIGPDQRLYLKDGMPKDEQPVKPVSYSVIKSGLIGLTRYLATYWSLQNVRCNALCPGGVENEQPEDFLARVRKKIPLGRLADVDEYQGTIVWMLSDGASYLNGAIVTVDGGRTIW